MTKEIFVTKRNGKKEKFNIEKIHKVIEWAVNGYTDVNLSDIEINANLSLRDGISTEEIHSIVIESAANLISEEIPNYQYVAGRLLNYQLRKEVWGGKNAPKLFNLIKQNIEKNLYDENLLKWYSRKEIDKIDEYLDHDRDLHMPYSGIRQLCDKYLMQDRNTKEIFETPQFLYVLIAMVLFHKYPEDCRLDYIKRAYNFYSKNKINLPTPLLAGARSKMKSWASCCLIDVDDNMKSILASSSAVGHATASRYGIGFNFGRIRAIGSSIRNGEVMHTGVIPFLKIFEAMVKSCQQAGLRGGSATCNFPIWHYEIEDILVLKNNAGTDDNRVRKLDYCIGFSKLFYDRFIKDGTITLFSPHEVKDLYEAFGHENFDELYCKYEKDNRIKIKKIVSARELFKLFIKERVETGRIYILNVDNANSHGSWLDDIKMANLCLEINQPIIPMNDLNDSNAEIGVCVLSAFNVVETKDNEIEEVADIIVRGLEELIDIQTYFNKAAENFATKRRSLGVGITNLAGLLAKNGLGYDSSDAPNFVDELMEKIQFYLLKSSVQLSKERGPCEKFNRTKYSQGILPIDTYKKSIDKFVTRKLSLDWEGLREDIKQYGMRHSTLSAMMPCESSSVIQSSTNGCEPVRALITFKTSKTGKLPVLVPGISKYGNKYTLCYDLKDMFPLININAAIQKYTDMAMSTNLYYNYSHYDKNALPDTLLFKHLVYAWSVGLKTLYYNNVDDGDKEQMLEKEIAAQDDCASGVCKL